MLLERKIYMLHKRCGVCYLSGWGKAIEGVLVLFAERMQKPLWGRVVAGLT